MTDDPFAFQVERLTHRHRHRHTTATVAEVVLQRWLVMRRRYSDPFAAELFDRIDDVLLEMPPSLDRVPAEARPAAGRARPTHTDRARLRAGRRVVDRPVSRSA